MNRDDDPQLWDLLGKTAERQPSPFFSRNVLREIRGTRRAPRPWFSWLSPRIVVPLAGCAAAVIAAFFATQQIPMHQRTRSPQATVLAHADSDDSDIAADLDDLEGGDDDVAEVAIL